MATRFWADSAEPKRKFRFILTVQKQGVPTIEKWLITKVTRPSFQVSGNPIKYLNHTFNFPGTVEWMDVSFTMVDAVSDNKTASTKDGSAIIMQMLNKSGYRIPGDGSKIISKESAIINMTIETIDSSGDVLDAWKLHNAWISQATFGDLDYSSDEIVSIDVTVKYDYATYTVNSSAFTRKDAAYKTLSPLAADARGVLDNL